MSENLSPKLNLQKIADTSIRDILNRIQHGADSGFPLEQTAPFFERRVDVSFDPTLWFPDRLQIANHLTLANLILEEFQAFDGQELSKVNANNGSGRPARDLAEKTRLLLENYRLLTGIDAAGDPTIRLRVEQIAPAFQTEALQELAEWLYYFGETITELASTMPWAVLFMIDDEEQGSNLHQPELEQQQANIDQMADLFIRTIAGRLQTVSESNRSQMFTDLMLEGLSANYNPAESMLLWAVRNRALKLLRESGTESSIFSFENQQHVFTSVQAALESWSVQVPLNGERGTEPDIEKILQSREAELRRIDAAKRTMGLIEHGLAYTVNSLVETELQRAAGLNCLITLMRQHRGSE